MKFKLFISSALLCMALSLWAVPARRGVWRTIQLTDGTEVRAQLVGDEFRHYYVAEDGSKYVESDSTDLYCLLTESASSQIAQKSAARRSQIRTRQVSRLRRAKAQENLFKGTKKGLVILVQFTDSKFQTGHNLELYKQIVNGDNYKGNSFQGSVKDYFKAQSQGVFQIDFDVVGICTLSHNCSYYGANDRSGNDLRPGAMVAEACEWAHNQGVDFSQYDWDGDGYVDEVFVLYAGLGEADGGSKNTIWPHMSYLRASDYGQVLNLDGVAVDTYACSAELNYYRRLDGVGTFCHEFSHCMGLVDLYDTTYSGWYGMGDFDLMDSGNLNDDGRCPAGYSAFEKSMCGWINLTDMTDINGDTYVSGLKAVSEGGDAYIVKNKGHEDEFYIVENRQKTNWDSALPDAGVMITHVDYNKYVWAYNVPNSPDTYYDWDDNNKEYQNEHTRVAYFHADNKKHNQYDDGHDGDLYGVENNSSLTSTSKPAATLYNTNADGTNYMHIDITEMAIYPDSTASMKFSLREGSSLGVESVKLYNNNDIVGYYSIDGNRLSSPSYGINIVHYANGEVKKVVMK